MQNLKVLDLRNNKILYVHGIAALEGMNMVSFRVEGNKVTKRPKFQETMDRILDPQHKDQVAN